MKGILRHSQINKNKRIHHHQTCSTRNTKGSPSHWTLDSNLNTPKDIKRTRKSNDLGKYIDSIL